VTRDLKPTRLAIRRAVEEFGSIYHLAKALEVTQDELLTWLAGSSDMPQETYEAMLEVVASRKTKRLGSTR
jgi:hypothetical protein